MNEVQLYVRGSPRLHSQSTCMHEADQVDWEQAIVSGLALAGLMSVGSLGQASFEFHPRKGQDDYATRQSFASSAPYQDSYRWMRNGPGDHG